MPSENVPIKVVAKCRYLSEAEKSKGTKKAVSVSGVSVAVTTGGKEQSFTFDQAYGEGTKPRAVYDDHVDALLQRALNGYNVAVVAFGTADSGKSQLLAGSDDAPGLVPCLAQRLYHTVGTMTSREYFITVTFVEVDGDDLVDLLNPHTQQMMIRDTTVAGIYVDGLSELVVNSEDDLTCFYTQGNRARKMGATDLKSHNSRSSGVFTVTVEQHDAGGAGRAGLRARIVIADLAGTELAGKDSDGTRGGNPVARVLTGLKKGGAVPYRDAKITRLLQDALGGNSVTLVCACVSPSERQAAETALALQVASAARGHKNKAKVNLDENENLISELRNEIAALRTRIVKNPDNRDDVLRMEEMTRDLAVAKRQRRDEKERLSSQYEQERQTNLANKGILEWVMETNKKENQQVQEKIIELQKEKDYLTLEYRERRKRVDDLKENLQKQISDYTKVAQSGKAKESETKKRVTAIHELKDQLKGETEGLREVKQALKDAQDQQRTEKEQASGQALATQTAEFRYMVECEERKRMEKENKAMIADEMERAKIEADQEKVEIQVRASQGGATYSHEESVRLEMGAVDARAERSVVTLQMQALQQEKALCERQLEELYKRHTRDLEVQQLHHFNTFREYRAVFEQQKAVIEARYRSLLEDAIQDAVFLSSRNTELSGENSALKQQLAEMKDQLSLGGGRNNRAESAHVK